MKKTSLFIFMAIMLMALTACGGSKSDETAPNDGAAAKVQSSSTMEVTPANEQQKSAQSFSIDPVTGWELEKGSSTETIKTYILMEPYIGAMSFYLKYFSDDILEGKDTTLEQTFKDDGFKVSTDKITVGKYQAIRYMITSDDKLIQMQALYYINVEGDQDIFAQLVAPNDKFKEAQSAWEEALKTLKPGY